MLVFRPWSGSFQAGNLCCTATRALCPTCLFLQSRTLLRGWDHHYLIINHFNWGKILFINILSHSSSWNLHVRWWAILSMRGWRLWPRSLRAVWETACSGTSNWKLCGHPTMWEQTANHTHKLAHTHNTCQSSDATLKMLFVICFASVIQC